MSFILHPRLRADTHHLIDAELSQILLMDDARFPWLILVPRRFEMRELIDLEEKDQQQLLAEISHICHTLKELFQPDKLNIAALGNLVPQLHVHVIARYTHDAIWPAPVWGTGQPQKYDAFSLEKRLNILRHSLKKEL